MIPPGICQCGCGKPTTLSTMTNGRTGAVKGQPNRYLRGHNKSRPVREPATPGGLIEYAEQVFGISEQLVAAVHDEGPDTIRAHLARAMRIPPPPEVSPLEVLVTCLAAQVDPDATRTQRVGWVEAIGRSIPLGAPLTRASPAPPEENAA